MPRATLYLDVHRSPQQSCCHLVQEFPHSGGGGGGGPSPNGVTLKKKKKNFLKQGKKSFDPELVV